MTDERRVEVGAEVLSRSAHYDDTEPWESDRRCKCGATFTGPRQYIDQQEHEDRENARAVVAALDAHDRHAPEETA